MNLRSKYACVYLRCVATAIHTLRKVSREATPASQKIKFKKFIEFTLKINRQKKGVSIIHDISNNYLAC
jgi:hypothetical protein